MPAYRSAVKITKACHCKNGRLLLLGHGMHKCIPYRGSRAVGDAGPYEASALVGREIPPGIRARVQPLGRGMHKCIPYGVIGALRRFFPHPSSKLSRY